MKDSPDVLSESILRERDNPSGTRYRVYFSRPLTDEEVRMKRMLKEKDLIESIPGETYGLVYVTHNSEQEAVDWVDQRIPDDWNIVDAEVHIEGEPRNFPT